MKRLALPLVPERESWGMDEESIAAYRAAERLAGGPAPMRQEQPQK